MKRQEAPQQESDGEPKAISFDPGTLRDKLRSIGGSRYAKIFALKKEGEKYTKFISRWQAHITRQEEEQSRQQLMQAQRGGACAASLRAAVLHPSPDSIAPTLMIPRASRLFPLTLR